MKYFKEDIIVHGWTAKDKIKGITLEERIFSIHKNPETGNFIFREECDEHFEKELTKEDAVEMLKEAIEWIERS